MILKVRRGEGGGDFSEIKSYTALTYSKNYWIYREKVLFFYPAITIKNYESFMPQKIAQYTPTPLKNKQKKQFIL